MSTGARGTVRVLAALIVVGLVVAASIGVAEVGLRLLPVGEAGYRDTSFPLPRLAEWPHADFRNRVYEPEKSPGTFRVVVLGDSYTWGHGLHPEDAYPDRLERRLADLDSEVDFEVVNWSHPGWNTDQEWHSIRRRLAEWSPDLLVLGFVLNDAEPAHVPRARLEFLLVRKPEGGLGGWLYRHSRVFSGFWDATENRRVRRGLIDYYHGLFEESENWTKCKRALRGLRDLAAKLRVPFLVVIFPIFDSQFDDDYPYAGLHAKVAGETGRLGIPTLDLLPAYRGVDATRLALIPFTDAHPSELAQRIAADAILDELLARGWIPGEKRPLAPRWGKRRAAAP